MLGRVGGWWCWDEWEDGGVRVSGSSGSMHECTHGEYQTALLFAAISWHPCRTRSLLCCASFV